MATVTIGKPYFEALLRRAEFHTSGYEFDTTPSLSSNVTISKREHDYLLLAEREYNLLKSALFRGGLSAETFDTLLSSGNAVADENPAPYNGNTREETFVRPKTVSVTLDAPQSSEQSPGSGNTAVGDGLASSRAQSQPYNKVYSFGQPVSPTESPDRDDDLQTSHQRVPTHDQRTILISHIPDRTSHKDLVDIIRGGRLLDIFFRNDRSATVSFVEGAQEFLAHAKRNDIYLHMKRLEFRWNDRQFHVPPHVSNKIANGATRNIVVRGAVGKQITADQIRDHLDHIHNLVVVDITMINGDAYVSTNSIHNALFARTCMMSRTKYKGLRIDWYPDECAAPLPKLTLRTQSPYTTPAKAALITNRYMVLDADGADTESDGDNASFTSSGVRINWADATLA